ncbi:MAG TPA: HemK family protein methyltransferase [Gemmatimonadota bacterium]|nr:HemK family protein methyltransferase [Gemmatimonadota bacterium]
MSTRVARRTVEELLEDAERRLEARKVEFPDASAVWLLAHALGVEDPDELDDRAAEPVLRTAENRFWKLVARRERHEPFQYIVGLADFRDALMEVTHGVFLPRLQSERMCDEIEEWARTRDAPRDGWRIADLGTGCGAIAVSLASGPIHPHRVWAVDISPQALALARRNAQRHAVSDRVGVVAGDWLEAFRPEPCLDVVVAVPPYLNPEDEQWISEESLRWEPLETFIGDPSGTEILMRLLDEAAPRLRTGGLVALQLDADQVPAIEAYVNEDPTHPLTVEWILQDEEGDEDAILAVKH